MGYRAVKVAENKKDEVEKASVESSWDGSNAEASSNVIDRLGDVCTGSQTGWKSDGRKGESEPREGVRSGIDRQANK